MNAIELNDLEEEKGKLYTLYSRALALMDHHITMISRFSREPQAVLHRSLSLFGGIDMTKKSHPRCYVLERDVPITFIG